MFSSSLLALIALSTSVQAHQSIWHPAVFGWNQHKDDPGSMIGPLYDLPQSQWWFRGHANEPTAGVVDLPAGGRITLEIACHIAWTSYSPDPKSTTVPGSYLDACPNNPGSYHTSDYDRIDPTQYSGCALGIADVDHVQDVSPENLTIFSTNQTCVSTKLTSFEVPDQMPPCKGKKCICAWFWLANKGQANFYMTGFDCSVSGSPGSAARRIGKPVPPVFTGSSTSPIPGKPAVVGPKQAIYVYNQGYQNTEWIGNLDRAGYHNKWSFPIDGAQTDIFTGELVSPGSNSVTSPQANIKVSAGSKNVQASVQQGIVDLSRNSRPVARNVRPQHMRRSKWRNAMSNLH